MTTTTRATVAVTIVATIASTTAAATLGHRSIGVLLATAVSLLALAIWRRP